MARQPVSMSIEGLDAVSDVLAKVGPREARNLLRNTVHAAAGQVRDEMRKRAVEDTGTLRKAITAKREKMRGNQVASNITITHGKAVQHNAFYWHMVEWGTTKDAAQPYITPSVEAMRPQIPAIFARDFGVKYQELMQRKLKAARKRK